MYFMDMMDLKKKDLQLYLVCKVVEPFHTNIHTDIISGLSPVLAEKSVRQLIMAANAYWMVSVNHVGAPACFR